MSRSVGCIWNNIFLNMAVHKSASLRREVIRCPIQGHPNQEGEFGARHTIRTHVLISLGGWLEALSSKSLNPETLIPEP